MSAAQNTNRSLQQVRGSQVLPSYRWPFTGVGEEWGKEHASVLSMLLVQPFTHAPTSETQELSVCPAQDLSGGGGSQHGGFKASGHIQVSVV